MIKRKCLDLRVSPFGQIPETFMLSLNKGEGQETEKLTQCN